MLTRGSASDSAQEAVTGTGTHSNSVKDTTMARRRICHGYAASGAAGRHWQATSMPVIVTNLNLNRDSAHMPT
jgi:hypothetical protein